MAVLAGLVLVALGVLSRLFALGIFRRISASATRDVQRSLLPGTPWFTVESDRSALKMIVVATYTAVLGGMFLVLLGLLVFGSFSQ